MSKPTSIPSPAQSTPLDVPLRERLAWSPREFAAVTGFSVAFIYREREAGRLRFQKYGARSLILREEGLAWLAAGSPGSAAAAADAAA